MHDLPHCRQQSTFFVTEHPTCPSARRSPQSVRTSNTTQGTISTPKTILAPSVTLALTLFCRSLVVLSSPGNLGVDSGLDIAGRDRVQVELHEVLRSREVDGAEGESTSVVLQPFIPITS